MFQPSFRFSPLAVGRSDGKTAAFSLITTLEITVRWD